jgi:cation:H+ antiporter
MTIPLVLLFIGLALLLAGGDLLVRGASALAQSLGISPVVIGLTVVAFGTSAPELAINLLAAYQGSTDISFGNIIGSNIANIGLVLGIAAMIRPLKVQGVFITREIPMMVLASMLALITGIDHDLKQTPNVFDRGDGLVFLLIFCVFLYYTIGDVVRKGGQDAIMDQVQQKPPKRTFKKSLSNLLLFFAGLILLVGGGKVAVDAAVAVAEHLGLSQVVVGLTIVAVGTSLPELVTSVVATWRGHTDIAIGNIVGSNIANLLLVNGLCAVLHPIPVPSAGGRQDLLVMVFLAVILLPLALTDHKRIVRWEGALLVVLYGGYCTVKIIG